MLGTTTRSVSIHVEVNLYTTRETRSLQKEAISIFNPNTGCPTQDTNKGFYPRAARASYHSGSRLHLRWSVRENRGRVVLQTRLKFAEHSLPRLA